MQLESKKEEKFAAFDLIYYIQVILKVLKFEPDIGLMEKILKNGANINYLSEYKENALFKVIINILLNILI
jgi:hypothetical protein